MNISAVRNGVRSWMLGYLDCFGCISLKVASFHLLHFYFPSFNCKCKVSGFMGGSADLFRNRLLRTKCERI